MRILAELIGAGCARLQVAVASRSEPSLGLGRLRASGKLLQLGPGRPGDERRRGAPAARRGRPRARRARPDCARRLHGGLGRRASSWPRCSCAPGRDADADALETIRDAAEVDEYVREEILRRSAAGPAHLHHAHVGAALALAWALRCGARDEGLRRADARGVEQESDADPPARVAPAPTAATRWCATCSVAGWNGANPSRSQRSTHARASGSRSTRTSTARSTTRWQRVTRQRAGALIWTHGTRYISGLDGRLAGWLAALGDEQVAQSPHLSLAAAFESLARGDADRVRALGSEGGGGDAPGRRDSTGVPAAGRGAARARSPPACR